MHEPELHSRLTPLLQAHSVLQEAPSVLSSCDVTKHSQVLVDDEHVNAPLLQSQPEPHAALNPLSVSLRTVHTHEPLLASQELKMI